MVRLTMSSFLKLLVFTVFLYLLIPVRAADTDNQLKEVDAIHLRYLIHDASTGSPACVLLQEASGDSKVHSSPLSRDQRISVTQLASLWQELPKSLKSWKIVVHGHVGRLTGEELPLLRCYLAAGLHQDFDAEGRLITLPWVMTWLKSVRRLHQRVVTSLNRILRPRIEEIVCGKFPTLLLFHGSSVSDTLDEIGSWVRDKDAVEVIDVFVKGQRGKKLAQHFRLFHFPSVVGFNKSCSEPITPRLRLEGEIEVSLTRVQLWVQVETSDAQRMNGNDLRNAVSVGHIKEPLLVCVYATWASRVLPFVNAFERSADSFTEWNASLQFALFDVSENKQYLSHYFNATVLTNLPALVLFHRSGSHTTIKTDTLLNAIPTPSTVYAFLKSMMDESLKDRDGNVLEFVPWSRTTAVEETPCEMGPGAAFGMCAASTKNLTEFDQSEVFESSVVGAARPILSMVHNVFHTKPRKKVGYLSQQISERLRLHRTGRIPIVTANVWRAVQEMALTPQSLYGQTSSKFRDPPTPVTLVVFIQEGCAYCDALLGDFNQLATSVEFIPGSLMFIVNCTTDRSLCHQEGISGYPSLYAYRGFTQRHLCIEKGTSLVAKRVPYHGVLRVTNILEWLSDISMPAVKFYDPGKVDEDSAQLVATLYSQSSANRHFRSLHRQWFPYRCLVTVCEQLLGQVVCYASYAPDVEDYHQIGNPIVSDVTLIRSDGIKATVYTVGRSLSSTLDDHSSSPLHSFHTSHRYHVTPTQTCEQDHVKCTHLLVRYVRDHRRPPVIPITDKTFHVDEDLLSDLPVMIALAHEANITANSSFYSSYSVVAKKLYSRMVFSTLNVDLYPSWAGKFVPQNFWTSTGSRKEEQAFYPRLCVVQGNDHTHAAFLPDYQGIVNSRDINVDGKNDQWTEETIAEFAERFLEEPISLLVRTEHF